MTEYIDLKSNKLSGLIPSQFGGMTEMSSYFDLQGNKLEGAIPAELFGE